MKISLHTNDIPQHIIDGEVSVALDTEAMGLLYHRDRLCLVQLITETESRKPQPHVHLVHFPDRQFERATHLRSMLQDASVEKIFHYARFDVGLLQHSLGTPVSRVFCTKIASKLVRTFTNRHGLKDLCKELLGVELSKEAQTSDWGAPVLSPQQQNYAANDVVHLHGLRDALKKMLKREGRERLAQNCFEFLPFRTELDRTAGEAFDIFSHN